MTLTPLDRHDGLTLKGRREQNANLTEIQTLLTLLSGIAATGAEINRVADVSARIVPLGATGAVPATAEGKIIRVGQDGSANTAITLTLPEATGSGAGLSVPH